jgi:hypothetical protein
MNHISQNNILLIFECQPRATSLAEKHQPAQIRRRIVGEYAFYDCRYRACYVTLSLKEAQSAGGGTV